MRQLEARVRAAAAAAQQARESERRRTRQKSYVQKVAMIQTKKRPRAAQVTPRGGSVGTNEYRSQGTGDGRQEEDCRLGFLSPDHCPWLLI